jgi:hypothetical protein
MMAPSGQGANTTNTASSTNGVRYSSGCGWDSYENDAPAEKIESPAGKEPRRSHTDPFTAGRPRRSKQKVPYRTRVAKRRRKKELAEQHKRIMRDIERRKAAELADTGRRAKCG